MGRPHDEVKIDVVLTRSRRRFEQTRPKLNLVYVRDSRDSKNFFFIEGRGGLFLTSTYVQKCTHGENEVNFIWILD